MFEEGKQLERNEARDSGEWLTKMTDKSKIGWFSENKPFFPMQNRFYSKGYTRTLR